MKNAKKREPAKQEPTTDEASTESETARLTKEDLAALRTNVKGGGPIPARCCEYLN